LEAGEIVALATTSARTIARATYGQSAFGVVANDEGILLGEAGGVPVAQAGKVMVKVNNEGGDIKIGDAITLSSEAGVGTRATTTSRIIGIALEDEDSDDFVQIAVRNELYFASETATALDTLFVPIEDNENDILWNRITTLASNFVDGVLSVTGIKTDELCVGDVCVDEAEFLQMVEQAGGNSSAAANGGDNSSPEPQSEAEVNPTPEPETEPISEPAPDPEPVAEPQPELAPDGGV
ncbi:MAG: hypothetical protein RL538_261, partial [Candidatus Parcubacteria bacterium]